ncbi:hypothetical protein KM043_013338 [Ampulex compressa]|nr:hypothetical protein KM043_013338 [Ampulex compressa]
MSSGKKGKKKKCKTVDLMSFLADGSGTPTVPLKSSSWVDEVEDEHEGFSSRSSKEPVVLPTAPRAARDPGIDEENIPANPPYVAYISNLPYDVDEDDLAEFFAEMKVSNMRLPKDSNKIRGYGYVEFEDRQSLIDALSITNTVIKTRRVRIEVSNSSNDERRGGRMGRDNRRDNYDDIDRSSGDWRSGPREESTTSDSDFYRSRYDNRERRDDRDASEQDNKPGAWRESSDRGRHAFRERGGFRDDDKDKEWSRYGDRGSRDRDGDRDRGSSFGPRRNYADSDWDRDGRSQGRSNVDSNSEPRTRPKLQLQPRTKPVEAVVTKEEPTTTASVVAPPSAPAVNIFGAAKPVDTTAREREIEERLAKSYADSRPKEEGDSEKRGIREGIWGRRNGEGRDDKEKDRDRPTWRSEEDKSRRTERGPVRPPTSFSQFEHGGKSEQVEDSKAALPSRAGPPIPKGPAKTDDSRAAHERDRKDKQEKDRDEVTRMPKAKDEQAPNFVASNKYSMLPDDVDPDNIDD